MNPFFYLLFALPYFGLSNSLFLRYIIPNQIVHRTVYSNLIFENINTIPTPPLRNNNSSQVSDEESWNCGEIPWDLLTEEAVNTSIFNDSNSSITWQSTLNRFILFFHNIELDEFALFFNIIE